MSKRSDAEAIVESLSAEGEEAFGNIVADFRRIWDLQGAGFNRGILNEASFHRDEQAYTQLKSFNNLEKAFWSAHAPAYMDRKR